MKEVDEDLFVEKKAKIRKIEESSDEEEIGPQLEPLTRLAYEEQVTQSRERTNLLKERNRHDVKREDERRLRDHEELYPRADPGTHARKVEKRKQSKALKATALEATDEPDVDVFGDDDVRAQLAKAASKRLEKQKLRQVRDLERDTERSDRIRKRKAVEERNMDTLRTLANRFNNK